MSYLDYEFDEFLDRRNARSAKWALYDEDVLPLWVADMDFTSPEPVLEVMRRKIDHGVLGYELPPVGLFETVCDRMARLYGWEITPEDITPVPGVVSGFSLATRTICQSGDGLLMHTPAYPPIYAVPDWQNLQRQTAPLALHKQGPIMRYELDDDAFEAAITPQTRMFLLCQPHNPVGRDWNAQELTRLAEVCLRHNLIICSDEIHSELLMGGARHTPLAMLAPEIAENTITLVAPSKTFNLAGLGCSFAIITNPHLRAAYQKAGLGLVPAPKGLSLAAAQAAFSPATDAWLTALLAYLTANRDLYVNYVAEHLPGLCTTIPEATYLAWLDCREAGIEGSPYEFFLKEARVALNDGAHFGSEGVGFVRLNFACQRATLIEALDRLKAALDR